MKGRKKRPTKLKALLGTARADRANPNEPVPPSIAPTCPRWLKGEARREWFRVKKLLGDVGLLAQLDRGGLTAYCVAWQSLGLAYEETQRTGFINVGLHGGPIQNPAFSMMDRAMKQLRAFGEQFGCSPSARARLVAQPKEPRDPFTDYLNQPDDDADADEENVVQ